MLLGCKSIGLACANAKNINVYSCIIFDPFVFVSFFSIAFSHIFHQVSTTTSARNLSSVVSMLFLTFLTNIREKFRQLSYAKKTWCFEIACFTAFGHHRIWRIEHTFSAKSLANAFKSLNILRMQCWRCYMREYVSNVYLFAIKIFYIIWESIVTLLTFYNFIFSLESLIHFIVKRSVQYMYIHLL